MTKLVDARGMTCPQPVIETLKAIAEADEVITIVDNASAVENVSSSARMKGMTVTVEEKPDGTWLTLRRTGAPVGPDPPITCGTGAPAAGPLVVFIPSDSLGRGPAELGERLAAAYLHALLDVKPQPATILFMNTGVKLVAEGSRAVDDLRALVARGVEVLACGTCLSYFELTEKLAVGRISNMYDIATALHGAGHVVSL